ncbi:MAG: outer membrane lipoprotein-sorting protein [Desulfobacteraceae bacterium]|nr:outer membrane lipoprotein-sorting protein [Desulfobacteraceae bacterium]
MNSRKTMWITAITLITFSLPLFIGHAAADDAKAREIMQKVEDRDDGDNQTSEMEMILIDKFNNERIRKIAAFSKDKGEDNLRLMFFLHPADVKDTAFLTVDYDAADKDDDQWLFLPALRKTKRIASSDQSGSFMGSDLNFSDMTSRNLEDFDFFLKKEMDVNGHKTWLIESIPRSKEVVEETGYAKSLSFIRQDNYVMVRAVRWVKDGGYLKYIDVKKLDLIDGIWVPTEMHITKKKGKQTAHKTILKFNNVKFNQELDEAMFSVRQMEKGL